MGICQVAKVGGTSHGCSLWGLGWGEIDRSVCHQDLTERIWWASLAHPTSEPG